MYDVIRDYLELEVAIKNGEFTHSNPPVPPTYVAHRKDLCYVTEADLLAARKYREEYGSKEEVWERETLAWKDTCNRIDARFRASLEFVFGMDPHVSEHHRQIVWDRVVAVTPMHVAGEGRFRDMDLEQSGVINRMNRFAKYADYASLATRLFNS